MVDLTAIGTHVYYKNHVGGIRVQGKEFVPRHKLVQTQALEFQEGKVKRWTIVDEDYLDELAELYKDVRQQ